MDSSCRVRRARARLRVQGFTLVELMMVVAIIGLIASAAVPNLLKLSYRAKRAEAREALRAIHTHQLSFQAEASGFADTFDELGFEIDSATRIDARTIQAPYYTYTMTALPVGADPRGNFRAVATGDIDPTDPELDILVVENGLMDFGGTD